MTLPNVPGPLPGDLAAADAIETVIVPRARDLGDFEVQRALPSAQRQMIGPFFVSSSKERIDAAKDDWARARFKIVPGDEKEFIPLPP